MAPNGAPATPDAARRPRVGLVHGFTQSGRSFAKVAAGLKQQFDVVTPDLPGHGPDPVAATGLAAAGRSLARAVGRASYVGYSLGGRCCLRLALDDRDGLVERLVLVGVQPGLVVAAERSRRRADDEALARRLEQGGDAGLPAFVDDWLAGPLFAHLDAEAADRPSRLVNTAAGLASSLRTCGTGAQAPMWDRLGQLELPVLVVVGAADEKFRPVAEATAEAIGPQARMAVVPGAGHAVPFEQPGAFLELLGEFLASP